MGIFVGWIIQKRWLTLTAFLLCVVGVFIFPRFPAPLNYVGLLAPVLLLMAVIYEGSARFGLRIGSRLRVAWALWIGLSALVLMGGIAVSGSSPALFIAAVAAFSVLAMAGVLAMGVIHARRLREEQSGPASGMRVGTEKRVK